jgi:TPR repeat protein
MSRYVNILLCCFFSIQSLAQVQVGDRDSPEKPKPRIVKYKTNDANKQAIAKKVREREKAKLQAIQNEKERERLEQEQIALEQKRIEDELQLADEYYDNGKVEEALAIYKKYDEFTLDGEQCYRKGYQYSQDKNYSEALKWIELGFDKGHKGPCARYLGWMNENGWGVVKDLNKAFYYYKIAAENDDATGMNNLGWFYMKGTGTIENKEIGYNWIKKSSELQNSYGLNSMGLLYLNGNYVKLDYSLAKQYFENAIEAKGKGKEMAYSNLGWMYESGKGVELDVNKAIELYKKSDNGYANSRLGRIYSNEKNTLHDYSKAIIYFERAIELGSSDAMQYLGWMYDKGKGVTQSNSKAFELYKQSADLNNANGLWNLAVCYKNGIGTTKSLSFYQYFSKKAANKNHKMAINNVAYDYFNGRNGFAENIDSALKYYLLLEKHEGITEDEILEAKANMNFIYMIKCNNELYWADKIGYANLFKSNADYILSSSLATEEQKGEAINSFLGYFITYQEQADEKPIIKPMDQKILNEIVRMHESKLLKDGSNERNIAVLYIYGLGVEKSKSEAKRYLSISKAKGYNVQLILDNLNVLYNKFNN